MRGWDDSCRWWRDAGDLLGDHPEWLGEGAKARGFAAGARWMHVVMTELGWRLPPFREDGFKRMGWLKYVACLLVGFAVVGGLYVLGWWWLAPPGFIAGFYAIEARMVFVFPESLCGARKAWWRSHVLAVSAGGTWRVMSTVMPLACRMLLGVFRRGGIEVSWLRGCLSVLLWHREVAGKRKEWVDSRHGLPLLEVGCTNPLLVRREVVDRRRGSGLKVLWISDLHWWGKGDLGCYKGVLEVVRKWRPDVCVLGGDFVETAGSRSLFRRLVRNLSCATSCVVLPGNHDRGWLPELRKLVIDEGGVWLPDEGGIRCGGWRIAGVDDELADIVCVHDPAELEGRPLAPGTVVLGGHLHGGQWVWREKEERLLPAAWFYRRAVLRCEEDGVTWIVGRGAGDTLPLRWNCPRELVFCEIR